MEFLEAHREARAQGLDILGFYHSHPDAPAVPSVLDLHGALPGASWVILSVDRGKAATTRSWTLTHDGEAFEEQTLERGGDALHV